MKRHMHIHARAQPVEAEVVHDDDADSEEVAAEDLIAAYVAAGLVSIDKSGMVQAVVNHSSKETSVTEDTGPTVQR